MIRVGPAGWSYEDWAGIVYPRPKPRGFHPLAYLSDFVGCIELNSSFYAYPRARNASRWVELVADKPDFRFLAKLHGDFTHGPFTDPRHEQGDWAARAELFREGLAPLSESGKLGAVLVQFPVTFRRGRVEERRLESIAELFADYALALEVRHASWFTPDARRRLADLRYSLAHIDLPHAKDHPPADHESTGPVGYLRLHGRNSTQWFRKDAGRDDRYDYLYDEAELDPLIARARRLGETHDETYVVTNNHFEGQAMANAIDVLFALQGSPVLAPENLVRRYPHLEPKVRRVGQGSLF